MTEVFNSFLFFCSLVFGIESTLISESTYVSIDFDKKEVYLKYYDIKQIEKDSIRNKKAIKIINTSSDFPKLYYPNLKLIEKKVNLKGKNPDIEFLFSFESKDDLLKMLKFNTTEFGDFYSSSDTLFYQFKPEEVALVATQQRYKNFENTAFVYPNNIKGISFLLSRLRSKHEHFRKLKSSKSIWKIN